MYSAKWRALVREAAIAGQSISGGLTLLRTANYAETGRYSYAFFSLSIGFERQLKLIYLIDYALSHSGAYPDNNDLRTKFGHDLGKLLDYTKQVHKRLQNPETRYPWRSGGIEDDIINFLSSFANGNRYYNLDFLGGNGSGRRSTDPISEWYTTVGEKILAKHYSVRQKKKDAKNALIIEATLAGRAHVQHTAEDGTPITNPLAGALQTAKNKVLQKYGTFYCAKIARFLYMIMWDLVHEAHAAGLEVPYLYELFFPFMNDDDVLLSRKTFPPRG